MLKVLVCVVCLVSLAASEVPILRYYHSSYGIAEAARIKQQEQAFDFDGGRIAGGSQTTLGQHPYMGGVIILLSTNDQSVCGSALLTNTRSVTAAHCWDDGWTVATQFTIVWGSLTLFSGGTRVTTNEVELHSGWNPSNANNDIAVIRHSSVAFTDTINAITLASGSANYAGSWGVAAGFGRTSTTDPITTSQTLKQVNLQVITNAACAFVYGNQVVIGSTLCTATTGGNSPCPGDAGGPLVVGTGDWRFLIGIGSFISHLGCVSDMPAGFARVTSYSSWIQARL